MNSLYFKSRIALLAIVGAMFMSMCSICEEDDDDDEEDDDPDGDPCEDGIDCEPIE